MGGTERLLASTLALLLLVPPAAGGPSTSLQDQDDAGSGTDAPDRFEQGLRIEPGSYTGQLFSAGNDLTPTPLLDDEDWYRFRVDEGERIRLAAGAPDAIQGSVLFELRRPDEGLANWTADGSSADDRGTQVVADRSGWWALLVTTSTEGETPYRFTLAVEDNQRPAAVRASTGWVAAGVHVEPGGSARIEVWDVHRGPTTDHRSSTFLIEDADTLNFAALRGSTVPQGVGAQAGGIEVDVRTETGQGGLYTEALRGVVSEPGTYHLVHLVQAPDLYVSAHVDPGEDARALGTSTGTDLTAAHPDDFEGTAGLDGGPLSASIDVARTVDVDGTLVGAYWCGGTYADVSKCTVERPDGSSYTFGSNYTIDLLTAPHSGVWTFERERSLRLDPLGFDGQRPLFVADVDLPGLGPDAAK